MASMRFHVLRSATSLAFVALVLGAEPSARPARADPAPDAEWERDADREVVLNSPLDAHGVPKVIVARAVDEASGRGIAGARVDVYPELAHPLSGIVPPPKWGEADEAGRVWHRRSGWTDAQGWTRIDLAGVGNRGVPWVFADAPGFALDAEQGSSSPIVFSLRRGLDVPIEVRDAWDRPLAGAEVGYLMGCGHTPEMRQAVTDEMGRAVIEQVDPTKWRCWIRHERAEAGYHDLDRWMRGAPPLVLRCRPGRAVEGTVLDAEGRPVDGAFVGWRSSHHGPWVATDSSGRFRLLGVPTGLETTLHVEVGDPPVDRHMPPPVAVFDTPPEGLPVVVRLPAKSEDASDDEPEMLTAIVTVECVRPSGERADPSYPVATRASDGRTFAGIYDDGFGSPLRFHLPPGHYHLRSLEHADPGASDELGPQELVVAGLQPRTVRCVTRPRRAYRIVVRDRPQGADVWLDTAAGSVALDSDSFDGGVFYAPAKGPVGLTIDMARGSRRILLPNEGMAPDAPPLEVRWDKPTAVRLRVIDPDGKPVPVVCTPWATTDGPVSSDSRESKATSEPEVDFLNGLPRWLFVRPTNPAWRARYVALPSLEALLSDESKRTIRVEPRGTSRLSIVRADGSLPRVVKVTVSLGRRTFEGFPADPNDWSADEDPEGLLRVGAKVRVEAMDVDTPVFATLEGEGPWTVTIPSASITVRVSADGGETLDDVTVLLDGAPHAPFGKTAQDGDVAIEVVPIRGVAPGPHDLVVASPGRRSRLFHVIIKEGEARVLNARLRPWK